ncbi:putative membrane protein [Hordeum vulgare]|nr:putative membrane protein [Hordeum vulgare]
MDDNISFHKEKSFRRGASYVVTMVAKFDEYTKDWLYLREGTVLPKKSCEKRGTDLLNLNVITSVDLTEWLRTKDSGNETINLGLPSYDMLCTVLHSIKAGSMGLLLGNGVEVDQQNRPQDLLLDWFFHPVLVLKDQMQVLKMTEQEVRFLERSTLFVGSSSATAGADVWDNGVETPRDPVIP